jgi:hypothetical protein
VSVRDTWPTNSLASLALFAWAAMPAPQLFTASTAGSAILCGVRMRPRLCSEGWRAQGASAIEPGPRRHFLREIGSGILLFLDKPRDPTGGSRRAERTSKVWSIAEVDPSPSCFSRTQTPCGTFVYSVYLIVQIVVHKRLYRRPQALDSAGVLSGFRCGS